MRFIILLLARWTCPNNRPTYPTYLMCRIGTAKFFTLLLLLYRTQANFIGSRSTWDNLRIIPKDKMPELTPLHESDRQILMEGLDGVLS